MIFAGFLLLPLESHAVGVAATPSELFAIVETGREASVRLRLRNPSAAAALYEVYPDELEDMVRPFPESLVLEGGEERDILINISPKIAGRFETVISVVARPLGGSGLQAGGGIKVPLYIEAKGQSYGLASIQALLRRVPFSYMWIAILVVLLSWQTFRRRSS